MASILFPSCAITLLFLLISPAIADPIFDAEGQLLQNGKAYVIFPDSLGKGGITVTRVKNSPPCPLYTTLKGFRDGLPINISTPENIMYLSTNDPIEFVFNPILTPCHRQLRWYVSKPKKEGEHAYIVVGVSEEFKSKYVFRIVKAESGRYVENVYHIKFCTLLSNSDFGISSMAEKCVDVGLLPDGLLGIVSSPNLAVYFAEAKPTDEAKMITL